MDKRHGKDAGAEIVELPLPEDIDSVAQGPSPLNEGRTFAQDFTLMFIPPEFTRISDEVTLPMTINNFEELVCCPQKKNAPKFGCFWGQEEYGPLPVKITGWVWISNKILPNRGCTGFWAEERLIKNLNRNGGKFQRADLASLITFIFMEYIEHETQLYGSSPDIYARCPEKVGGFGLAVGRFSDSTGLYVCFDDLPLCGVAVLRTVP